VFISVPSGRLSISANGEEQEEKRRTKERRRSVFSGKTADHAFIPKTEDTKTYTPNILKCRAWR